MKRKKECEDDLVTLVLVKWSLKEIFYCMTLLVKVINKRDPVDLLEESRFLDETLVKCSSERELSLCCFINEIHQNTTHFLSSGEDLPAVSREFTLMLRGCFLILLLYDPRAQRFILTNHKIHRLMLRSRPPGRTKVNQFMDRIVFLVNQFLSLSLSLQDLSLQCQSIWSDDFMLQRFQEPPYLNGGGGEENIQRTDHQQIWWTRVHRDSYPCLEGLDELGF